MRYKWRLSMLALVFTAAFSILFIRLWAVQVAQGEEYVLKAEQNQVTWVKVPAPRGEIVDRNGIPLATSRSQLVIEIDYAGLAPDVQEDVVQRLAAILDVPPTDLRRQVESAYLREEIEVRDGLYLVVLRDRRRPDAVAALTHPDFPIDADTAYVVMEQRATLPGVTVRARPVRGYHRGSLMGHVIGYIGLPGDKDLEERPALDSRNPIGKSGVEEEYDEFLQGTPGQIVYQITPQGEIRGEIGSDDPVQGATVRLTLDIPTQEVVEQVLVEAIDLSNAIKDEAYAELDSQPLPTERATAVIMEIETGAVLAMASYPTYVPQSFVGGMSDDTFEELIASQAFNNLSIQAQKPPASTFKAITYITSLEEGIFPKEASSAEELIVCSAQLDYSFVDRSKLVWRNWTYPEADGHQNLHGALRRSCNIYFWEIALSIWDAYKETDREGIVQQWARDLGMGRRTQVDIPYEREGLVGDRQLFEEWQESQPWRVREEGWLGGDLMNLVVGQGPILATPLQMAVAYAAILNGGTVYQPRVADRIESSGGELLRTMPPRVLRTVDIDPETVESLRVDLAGVVTEGTARQAFDDSGIETGVGGKTGTAQAITEPDGTFHDSTAWFIGVAPITSPRWVVAVMVDEGGSGGAVAAPAARAMMQFLMGEPVTPLVAGADTER